MQVKQNKKGFSLIEVMVSLAIIIIIFVGIYNLIIISLQVTQGNKAYVEAMEIGKQQIEYIHSLSYASVGTIAGTPKGVIQDCKTVNRGGIYEVCTDIEYKDDDFDGLISDASPDTVPNDYKVATVQVSWQGHNRLESIELYTKIVAATEEISGGQGLLRIKINDTGYLNVGKVITPVPNASVRIVNDDLGVDVTRISDADGMVNYLASSSPGYAISVSHNINPADWSIDMTYGTSTTKTPQHLTVLAGEMTYETFTIDKKGIINILTAQSSNLPRIWQVDNTSNKKNKKNIRVGHVVASNDLIFAWEEESATSSFVYLERYSSASPPVKQWTSDVKLSNTLFQKNPDIAAGINENVSYVVWQDNSIALRKTVYNPKTKKSQYARHVSPLVLALNMPNLKHDTLSYFVSNNKIANNYFNQDFDNIIYYNQKLLDFFNNKKTKDALAAGYASYGFKTQRYTGEIAEDSRTSVHLLDDGVDPDHTIVLMHNFWTTGRECWLGPIGGNCQPDEHQATAHLDTSGTAVTIERFGIPNSDSLDKKLYYSFYIIEALNNEFIVRDRDSLTIAFDKATSSEIIFNNFVDTDKVTVFSNSRIEMDYVDSAIDYNYLGYATAYIAYDGLDWRLYAERGGDSPTGDNYNTILRYQIVEWISPLISVQKGEIYGSIGSVENTFDLSASPTHDSVDMNRTWLYASMYHESNGIARTSVRIRLIDDDTIGYQRTDDTFNTNIRWWTIEFPRGVVIQRGQDSAGSSDNNESVSLGTAVTLNQSWSDSYRACDENSTSREKFPRDRWTETLSDASTLSWWRRSDGEETYFNYQVIDTSDWDQPVEVSTIGTQTATIDSPSTSQYIGGAFVISKYNYSSLLESVTISEHGSVDAKNKLENIKIRYDIDTTLPLTCDDESYDGTEPLFGVVDVDGFSGANGTSTFTTASPLKVSASSSLCLYVELDIKENVIKYDTLDIRIKNPSTALVLQAGTGYILDTENFAISGSSELLLPAMPDTRYYAWRDDDGDETTASTYGQNQFVVKKPGDIIRLRLSVNNSGSISTTTFYELKYGKKIGAGCSTVALWTTPAPGNDWELFNSSNIVDASASTDTVILTNPNSSFIAGSLNDQTNPSPGISLDHDNYTEIEFSLISDINIDDAEYCFRLEGNYGSADFIYSVYPEITIVGDYNIFIKKINNGDGSTVWVRQVNSNEEAYIDRINPRVTVINNSGADYPVVVWQNSNNDLYMQKYDNNGIAQWNGGTDHYLASTSAREEYPVVQTDSNEDLLIAWVSDYDIKLQKFASTSGVSLWTATTSVTASANNYYPEIMIDNNDNYYLTWEKSGGSTDVILAKYDNTSVLQWSLDANLSESTYNQGEPHLALDNTNSFVYVTWTDDRRGDQDIYAQKRSFATGAADWTSDYRLNFDTGGDSQSESFMIMRGTDPVTAWQDNDLVLAAKFLPAGPSALAPEPNTWLVASSSKTISLNPETAKIINTFQTDGIGTYSYYTEYDFNGYTFYASSGDSIYTTDPAMPLVLNPNEITDIVIYID